MIPPRSRGPGEGRRKIPRNVRAMGWTSLVNDAASELLYPVLPLFLVTTLHAPVAAVGLVEGAAEAASQIVGYIVGRRSDRIHRRLPFVWAGYTLSNIAKPLVALAPAWGWVLGARVLDRAGKGVRTAPARRAPARLVRPRPGRGDVRIPPLHGLGRSDRRPAPRARAPRRRALAAAGDRRVDRSGRPHDVRASRRPRGGPARGARAARLRRPATCRARSGRSARHGSSSRSGTRPTSSCSCGRATSASRRRPSCSPTPSTTRSTRASRGRSGTSPTGSAGGGCSAAGLVVFAAVYAGFGLRQRDARSVWPLFALYGCYMAATDGVARALVADLSPDGPPSDRPGHVSPPDRQLGGRRQHRRRSALVERRARRGVRAGSRRRDRRDSSSSVGAGQERRARISRRHAGSHPSGAGRGIRDRRCEAWPACDTADAHAIGTVTYQFPVPLWLYVLAGAIAVAASVPAAALADDPDRKPPRAEPLPPRLGPARARRPDRLGAALLIEIVAAGLFGSQEFATNPATVLALGRPVGGARPGPGVFGPVWDLVNPSA